MKNLFGDTERISRKIKCQKIVYIIDGRGDYRLDMGINTRITHSKRGTRSPL